MEQANEYVPSEIVKTPDLTLAGVVDELFDTGRTTFLLRSGKEVVFQQAKFRHVAKITELFETLIQRVPKEKMMAFLDMVADHQASAMEAGKAPYDMSLNAAGMLEKAIGQSSLLMSVFNTSLDQLPKIVPLFSNLTADEFNDLDIDEAVVAAAGVVAVNYSFFTQNALPILKSVLAGWSRKGMTASGVA